MSSEQAVVFTKANLDEYLKELGKAFRKLNGTSVKAEIILIGGAAILANYSFRQMTADVDAVIHASSSIKDAIGYVADKFVLPKGWLNSDFTKTGSYSPKLDEISVYYKTFSNVLNIRTVSAEYLIAIKLCSGRKYKSDLSDIIGILYEHQKNGLPISMDDISRAVNKLYGGWGKIPESSKAFIDAALKAQDYKALYTGMLADEKLSREVLIDFAANNPGIVGEANANEILASLKEQK